MSKPTKKELSDAAKSLREGRTKRERELGGFVLQQGKKKPRGK